MDQQRSLTSLRPKQIYFGTKHLREMVKTLESAGFRRIGGRELVETNPDQFWDEPPSRVRGGIWNAVYRRSLFIEEDSQSVLDVKIDVNPQISRPNNGSTTIEGERARISFDLVEQNIGMVGKAIAALETEKVLMADGETLEASLTHYPFSAGVRLALNTQPEDEGCEESRTARRNNALLHDVIAIESEGDLLVADFSRIDPERYVKAMIETARDVHEGLMSFKIASRTVKTAAYGKEAEGLEKELAKLDPDDAEGLERLIQRYGGMDAFIKKYENMRSDAERSWSAYMEDFARLIDIARPLLTKIQSRAQSGFPDRELSVAEIVVALHQLDRSEVKALDGLLEELSWETDTEFDRAYTTKRLKNDLINGYEAIRTMLAMNDTFQHIAGLIADRFAVMDLGDLGGEGANTQDYLDDIWDAVPVERRV